MCHWSWTAYADAKSSKQILSLPILGGLGVNQEDKERQLRRIQRPLRAWLATHPGHEETLNITLNSCNGPQERRFPFRAQGEHVEPYSWDFGDPFDEPDETFPDDTDSPNPTTNEGV